MKWVLKEMQPGDMVRVPSGSFYHYAICTGDDSIIQFGDSIVNPNVDPETVEVNEVGIDEFLKGRFAQVAEFDKKELKRKNSPAKIVLNAKMSIGKKGYHILYNNCEHFANECVFNDHKCSQTESFRENFGKTFPMIDVYVSDVSRYKNNNQLPKYAKHEIKKCKNESVIEQKKSVYGLLDYAVTSSFNKSLECKKLFKNKSGKPCHKNYFVSFSHTDELICVAVSKQNIGVDIEEIKEHKALDPLKSHILSSEEAASSSSKLLAASSEDNI